MVKSSLSNKALEDPCGRPLVRSIAQSIFLRQPGAEFRYLLSSEEGVMIEHLRRYVDEAVPGDRYLAPLEEFVTICRGEELGRESPHLLELTQVRRQGELYPLLRGGIDIQAYGVLQGSWGIKREAIMKPLERYLTPKLLVVKSTDRLQAAVDIRGHVALQTLYLLHLRDKNRGWDDLYFFLALLNSRLLQNYVYLLHTAYKWVQPQIEQHVLARLPIPIAKPEERQPIIERAKCLVRACSEGMAVVEWKENISRMYEEQERAICALYRLSMFGDE